MILPANRLTINTQSVWMMHWIYDTIQALWITFGWITALTILLAVTFIVSAIGNSSIQSQCRINSYASQINSQKWCLKWNSVFKIPVCPSVVTNEDLKTTLIESSVKCAVCPKIDPPKLAHIRQICGDIVNDSLITYLIPERITVFKQIGWVNELMTNSYLAFFLNESVFFQRIGWESESLTIITLMIKSLTKKVVSE